MQVSSILSEPNEEEVQLLHAIDILIPNQSVTSWSDDEDACRNNHSTMLQDTSQGGVSNGTKQITPCIRSSNADGRVMCCSRNQNSD